MKELEMVLTALAQLGEAGKDAFIWWLIVDKIVVGAMWLVGVSVIAVCLYRAVFAGTLASKLRDEMGIGTPGPVIPSEAREMHQWISQRRDRPAA